MTTNINRTADSLYLAPVTSNEIIKHIASLKSGSSKGLDKISSEFIKRYHIYLLKPLVHIINLIFCTGAVPREFKESLVTPVFKKGDRSEITNYRPISLLNNFAKLLEKAIKTRLITFLEKHKILSNSQFGFREGVSTEDAVFNNLQRA